MRQEAKGLWSWLTTVDHKRIGIMYFVVSFFFRWTKDEYMGWGAKE